MTLLSSNSGTVSAGRGITGASKNADRVFSRCSLLPLRPRCAGSARSARLHSERRKWGRGCSPCRLLHYIPASAALALTAHEESGASSMIFLRYCLAFCFSPTLSQFCALFK